MNKHDRLVLVMAGCALLYLFYSARVNARSLTSDDLEVEFPLGNDFVRNNAAGGGAW